MKGIIITSHTIIKQMNTHQWCTISFIKYTICSFWLKSTPGKSKLLDNLLIII